MGSCAGLDAVAKREISVRAGSRTPSYRIIAVVTELMISKAVKPQVAIMNILYYW
jgi:hypothetical protein